MIRWVLAAWALGAAPVAAADVSWRVTAGGSVNGLAVVDTGGGPEQRPAADATTRLDVTSPLLSARLEVRGRVGGPFVGGSGVDAYNFDDTFQNQSPAFEFPEWWVGARMGRWDARLGMQRFAWGKLDGQPPTDVLNPRDYHDPLVLGFEERKIGVPAVSLNYFPRAVPVPGVHDVKIGVAWLPFAVPSRLALPAERWFARSTELPRRLPLSRRLLNALDLCPAYCQSPQTIAPIRLATVNETPPRDVEQSGIAVQLAGAWRDVDWALSHYSGPETAPLVALRPELFVRPGATFPSPDRLPLGAVGRLTQAHRRIHMTGIELATSFGGLTVRGEAAYFDGRPYLRAAQDLLSPATLSRLHVGRVLAGLARRGRAPISLGELFPTHDAIEWGIGADYLWNGWLPLLQLNQIAILDHVPGRLLIGEPETRLTGSLKKSLFAERVEIELRSTVGIERSWWFVMPRVAYRVRDDLRVRAGYLAIGGPSASYLGQFRENDQVLFQVHYTY